jgi:hypothetical protein
MIENLPPQEVLFLLEVMMKQLIEKLKLISRVLDDHYSCTKELSTTVAGKIDDDLKDVIRELSKPRDMFIIMRIEDNGSVELDSMFDTEDKAKEREKLLDEPYFRTTVTYYP